VGRLLRIVVIGIIVFGAIQLVPYGRDHTNPRSIKEPTWDSNRTRQLTQAACFDCHSNLTEWPWYTSVAPISWITQRDVEEGRPILNFSEWQRVQEANIQEVREVIREGKMPPLQYRLIHSNARLSDQERQELELGLARTWAQSPPGR
jgi:hypothetical protein